MLAKKPDTQQQQNPPPVKEPKIETAASTSTPTRAPVARHQYDIGNFVNPAIPLTDQEKYDVLCQVWKPDPSYVFPARSGRRFQYQWFATFPWLAYSEMLDGAFCINCVLFGNDCSQTALTHLFKSPLTSWSVAIKRLRDHHGKSPIHSEATARSVDFKSRVQKRSTPINLQVNKMVKEQVEKNRHRLKFIVEAVVLCGRQSIALRGHRDDTKHQLLEM